MSGIAWIRVSGAAGMLAVILGAFGAHGLEGWLSAEMMEVYEIGVRYHFYHALAMLAVSLAMMTMDIERAGNRACFAWVAGIAIFSGSLYLLAVTGMKWLGMITPIGGVAFIVGWAFLLLARIDED